MPLRRRDGPASRVGALTPVLGSPEWGEGGPASLGGLAAGVPYIGEERELGEGDTFGELSFFTEIPQMTTVRCAQRVPSERLHVPGAGAAARAEPGDRTL